MTVPASDRGQCVDDVSGHSVLRLEYANRIVLDLGAIKIAAPVPLDLVVYADRLGQEFLPRIEEG